MDFTQFDSRKAAAKPGRLHVCHPATGELLYADAPKNAKPCIFLVLGNEAPQAVAETRRIQKEMMKTGKDDEQPGADLHPRLCRLAKPLLVGFENIEIEGRSAKAPDDVEAILALQSQVIPREGQRSFAEQVMVYANNRANFLGNGSSG